MRTRWDDYAFRPRWAPSLATLLLLPVLISLGSWQLRKFEAKRSMQQQRDQRSQADLRPLAAAATDPREWVFRHVSVRGRFEPQRQFLLDNRIYREQAGYQVLTPLRIENSEARVLVNRGWVAAPTDHKQLPDIATPTGEVELRGVAVVPSRKIFALAPEPTGWHAVWQNLDLDAWGQAAGIRPLPVVVQLDADSPAGFVRDWPRPDDRMEQNLSYAFQWYGFATALVGFWLVASLKRRTA